MADDPHLLGKAAAALRVGEVVVYPTETLYGLGVDALSSTALERLGSLKGPGRGAGMSVLVADVAAARPLLAEPLSSKAKALAANFWPGPLTLVVPAASGLDDYLIGPGGGIGLRCPHDCVARALVKAFGGPITATSANPSALAPADDVAAARSYFGDQVSVYLDGGPRFEGRASTVVSLLGGEVMVLREGVISAERIRAVLARAPLSGTY